MHNCRMYEGSWFAVQLTRHNLSSGFEIDDITGHHRRLVHTFAHKKFINEMKNVCQQ